MSTAQAEATQIVTTSAAQPITLEPEPKSMDGVRSSDDDDRHTVETYSDDASGYERELNECTEFCLDLFTCFGAFDACCPATGEGCCSSTAAFFGNICVGLFKC